jgi:hypothetical protein
MEGSTASSSAAAMGALERRAREPRTVNLLRIFIRRFFGLVV